MRLVERLRSVVLPLVKSIRDIANSPFGWLTSPRPAADLGAASAPFRRRRAGGCVLGRLAVDRRPQSDRSKCVEDHGNEREQLFERREPRRPPGREVLHATLESVSPRSTSRPEVDDERAMHGEIQCTVEASSHRRCLGPVRFVGSASHVTGEVQRAGGRSPGKSQGLLRECRGKLGQLDEGLAVVADALAMAEASEAHYWDAELERLQGTLTLRRGTARAKAGRGSTPAEIDAEACFRS